MVEKPVHRTGKCPENHGSWLILVEPRGDAPRCREGCVSQGTTQEELKINLAEALNLYLEESRNRRPNGWA